MIEVADITINITREYLEKTTPAERLIMISPGVEVIPPDEAKDISIGLTTNGSGDVSAVTLNFLQHYTDGIKDIEKIT